jgi:hypothetical protein
LPVLFIYLNLIRALTLHLISLPCRQLLLKVKLKNAKASVWFCREINIDLDLKNNKLKKPLLA